MKIFVDVKPGSKREGVLKIDGAHFVVRLRARPIEGKANDALIRALAGHFQISPSRITIVSGMRSKNKVIELR